MMQSISHWGQFEMQAAGTWNFKEQIVHKYTLNELLAGFETSGHRPTSFFVSRQDAGAK